MRLNILEKKIELLKNILNDSRYTVMLGGSGMMKEGGYQGLNLVDSEFAGLNERVRSVAVHDSQRGRTYVCLLNKNGNPLEIAFDGDAVRGCHVRKMSVFSMSDDLEQLEHKTSKSQTHDSIILEPYSLTFVAIY